MLGLGLQVGRYGVDLFVNPPVEFFFAGLELLLPFGQCSFLPQRLSLEFSFSPLGDLVVDRLADRDDLATARTRDLSIAVSVFGIVVAPGIAGIAESRIRTKRELRIKRELRAGVSVISVV